MTPNPDTDPAPATLAGIRERNAQRTKIEVGIGSDPADFRLLLAALDAVLKQHQPGRIVVTGSLCKRHENHRHFSITSTEAADVRACRDCEATVYSSCSGCGHPVPVDSCPVREAIRTTLSGKETGDGK